MSNKTTDTPAKEFEKIIRGLAYRHHLWRVFSDFCEMSAISIENVLKRDLELEKRYEQIVEPYNDEERREFARLLGCTVRGLEELDCDFLGERFMQLELGSHWHGQFFTPFHISQVMAKIILGRLTPAHTLGGWTARLGLSEPPKTVSEVSILTESESPELTLFTSL